MATESSTSGAAQFSEYDRLVIEYHEIAARCQAELDQLAAAERELRAVASVMNGESPDVDREIASAQARLVERNGARNVWGNINLSKREREVFEMMGEGLSTHEIAGQLQIALSTVETYRERLKSKLKLNSGSALVRQAVLWVVSRDGGAL
jgi:DNA-binding NarL/FixJ family response regulator